jgi:hypothetical protein
MPTYYKPGYIRINVVGVSHAQARILATDNSTVKMGTRTYGSPNLFLCKIKGSKGNARAMIEYTDHPDNGDLKGKRIEAGVIAGKQGPEKPPAAEKPRTPAQTAGQKPPKKLKGAEEELPDGEPAEEEDGADDGTGDGASVIFSSRKSPDDAVAMAGKEREHDVQGDEDDRPAQKHKPPLPLPARQFIRSSDFL